MRTGLLVSCFLHLCIAGLFLGNLPLFRRPLPEPVRTVSVELVSATESVMNAPLPSPSPDVEDTQREPSVSPSPVSVPEKAPALFRPARNDMAAAEEVVTDVEEAVEESPPALDFDALDTLIDRVREEEKVRGRQARDLSPPPDRQLRSAGSLDMDDRARMQEAVARCWNAGAIAGAPRPEGLVVIVDFELDRTGELLSAPVVVNAVQIALSGNAFWKVAGQLAVRAVAACAPYDFLPDSRYDMWREFRITFDPREMTGSGR